MEVCPGETGASSLFPPFPMEHQTTKPERRLFIVEFEPVAVWATDDERLSDLVSGLLDGRIPDLAEAFPPDHVGITEEEWPYAILNTYDGDPT